MKKLTSWQRRFRDARFNRKLMILSMVSSIAALSLTGSSLIALDLAAEKRSIERNLIILSQVVGSNSSAALLFDDSKAAHETLAGLAAHENIVAAAIYDRSGANFATFMRPSAHGSLPAQAPAEARHYESDFVTLASPIIFQNERIGTIFLRYNLQDLNDQLHKDLAVVSAILLLSFLASYLLSSRLKDITSKPILHLAEVAREVTVRNNYSLRAVKYSGDELGKLTEDFNTMLGEVQRRDEQKTAAERKFAFLAEASTILGRSLEYRENLEEVARHSIPYLGDWCIIDLCAPVEARTEFAVTGADGMAPPANEFKTEMEAAELIRVREDALRSGRTVLSRELPLSRARCALSVPLVARGHVLGAITLVSMERTDRYGEAEVSVAEDLARRAAFAVDNARLYQDAEVAIQLRDEFISIASHELKTPLTTLQLQFQGLMKGVVSGQISSLPKERVLKMQDSAQRQFQKFARLIGDLLDVSRLSTGKVQLDLESMDLRQLVQQIVEDLAPELERAGCAVELQATKPVPGEWDRTRIEQAISNLVTNAAKYGAGKPIIITVSEAGGKGTVGVRDFGIGIAKNDQARIFERFERAVSVRHFGGFGLGLFIAQQNIAAHGGRIWVESAPGEGSTFSFEVPLHPVVAQREAG